MSLYTELNTRREKYAGMGILGDRATEDFLENISARTCGTHKDSILKNYCKLHPLVMYDLIDLAYEEWLEKFKIFIVKNRNVLFEIGTPNIIPRLDTLKNDIEQIKQIAKIVGMEGPLVYILRTEDGVLYWGDSYRQCINFRINNFYGSRSYDRFFDGKDFKIEVLRIEPMEIDSEPNHEY